MNYTFARILFWIGIILIIFGLIGHPILLGLFLITLAIIAAFKAGEKEEFKKYKERHYNRRENDVQDN